MADWEPLESTDDEVLLEAELDVVAAVAEENPENFNECLAFGASPRAFSGDVDFPGDDPRAPVPDPLAGVTLLAAVLLPALG